MDMAKKIEIPVEDNDLELKMNDENTMSFIKSMGFIENDSTAEPISIPKSTGFNIKDFFIIISCLIIGAVLSFIYLNKATAVREELRKVVSTDEFWEMVIANGSLAQLSGFDGKDGLPGEKGEPGPPGPPGPMGGVNQGAFNGVSGWELRESERFMIEPGNRKTVSMSCSTGKILLGGGYNAEECADCSGITSYPSSKATWETTLDNKTSDQPVNLKVYAICAQPTL
jgi:hypothetical protein